MVKQTGSGLHYFSRGFSLIFTPGIRRFVIIPLVINILLLGGTFYYALTRIGDWVDGQLTQLPTWLEWLSYPLWVLIALGLLVVCTYFFSTIANWIAAPFNGLLAEHLEARLTNTRPPDDGILDIVKDLPRVMKREWQKLWYYLPKAIGLLILFFIPAIGQTLGPVLWFLFTAWMMSVQYCDYAFDNHRVPFATMKGALKEEKGITFGFGALVTLLTMTPVLNLIVMPAAVCGATLMWVERYKGNFGRY